MSVFVQSLQVYIFKRFSGERDFNCTASFLIDNYRYPPYLSFGRALSYVIAGEFLAMYIFDYQLIE